MQTPVQVSEDETTNSSRSDLTLDRVQHQSEDQSPTQEKDISNSLSTPCKQSPSTGLPERRNRPVSDHVITTNHQGGHPSDKLDGVVSIGHSSAELPNLPINPPNNDGRARSNADQGPSMLGVDAGSEDITACDVGHILSSNQSTIIGYVIESQLVTFEKSNKTSLSEASLNTTGQEGKL